MPKISNYISAVGAPFAAGRIPTRHIVCERCTVLQMTTQEQAALVANSQDEEHVNHKSSGPQIGKLAVGSLLLCELPLSNRDSQISEANSSCTACFLANADESFVLTTGSDVASALNASSSAAWLITGYNLGYILALPIVSSEHQPLKQ